MAGLNFCFKISWNLISTERKGTSFVGCFLESCKVERVFPCLNSKEEDMQNYHRLKDDPPSILLLSMKQTWQRSHKPRFFPPGSRHPPCLQADAKFADADLSTKLKLLGVDVASFGGSSDFWFKRQYSSTGWLDRPGKVIGVGVGIFWNGGVGSWLRKLTGDRYDVEVFSSCIC